MKPILPTVALPTGAFDIQGGLGYLGPAQFEHETRQALGPLRAAMAELGVTHAVVHGNIFDSSALHRLTYFTPKLGPAYALVPAEGPLRILFSGGPGMKPSAQKLTWVEDVTALRGIEADIKRWLEETAGSATTRLGLVEGSSMMLGDWRAVQRAGGGDAIELNEAFAPHIGEPHTYLQRAQKIADDIAEEAIRMMSGGSGQNLEVLAAKVEYHLTVPDQSRSYQAEEIRWRLARRPNGGPTRLTGAPLFPKGDTPIVVAVRFRGVWAERQHVLKHASAFRGTK